MEMSPATATALGLLATTVIGALAGAVVKVIMALNANKLAGEARAETLARIEALVDGKYSGLLDELADLREAFAKMSGLPDDRVKADKARRNADDQTDRLALARRAAALATP